MKKILNESLIYKVLAVVSEIPFGKVATYGQIASLSGHPVMRSWENNGDGAILWNLPLLSRGESSGENCTTLEGASRTIAARMRFD